MASRADDNSMFSFLTRFSRTLPGDAAPGAIASDAAVTWLYYFWRGLWSLLLTLGISIASPVGFVVSKLGRPENPFVVALACTVLIHAGLVIGMAFATFELAILLQSLRKSRRVPFTISLAVFLGALAIALCLGAFSEIQTQGK
jgi:hypothetical protein